MASLAPEIPNQETIIQNKSISDVVTGNKQPSAPESNLIVSFNTKSIQKELSIDESALLEDFSEKSNNFQSAQARFQSQMLGRKACLLYTSDAADE